MLGQRRERFAAFVLALFAVLILRHPAGAVDGVIEINQVKALAGGVTPGDTPGFPVTISQGGSYRLTGNLTVPDANTTAIQITASAVTTVDLNGFTIMGPTKCGPDPCAPTGTGLGIDVPAPALSTRIIHGFVRGMGSHGIRSGNTGLIEGVQVSSNAGDGILLFSNGNIVRGSAATLNGGDGIDVGDDSTVTGNTATFNFAAGFSVGTGSTVINNTAVGNGLSGTFSGIKTFSDCTVIGNTAKSNVGFGLELGTGSGYANNVVNDNNGGNANPQVSGGIQMGTNVCGGDTTCP